MSLRDVEKEAVLIGRRWLHDLIFADWGLKLVALLVALGLWLAVTGQRAPAKTRLRGVALHFVLPGEMEIGNEPRERVDVIVRGSRSLLNTLRAGDVVVTYDASGHRPGERLVRLTPSNVVLELPEGMSREGLTVEEIVPATVPLRLERRVEREFEVEPDWEGQPPEGYELLGHETRPARVRVRGPESHINALGKVSTEKIVLEGRTASFVASQMAIDLPDARLAPVEPVVDVIVNVGERRAVRRIDGVQVLLPEGASGAARPARVSAEVRGPRSVVENLRADEIAVTLEAGADGAPRPRLRLPPALEGRGVELLSTQPAQFRIEQ
jgi:YbbR-like protein